MPVAANNTDASTSSRFMNPPTRGKQLNPRVIRAVLPLLEETLVPVVLLFDGVEAYGRRPCGVLPNGLVFLAEGQERTRLSFRSSLNAHYDRQLGSSGFLRGIGCNSNAFFD